MRLDSQEFQAAVVLLIGVLAWFAASQTLYKFVQLPAELCRKFGHVGAGTTIGVASVHLSRATLILFACLYLVGTIGMRGFSFALFHLQDRTRLGDLGFALALIILTPLHGTKGTLSMSIMYVAIADAAAGLTGQYLRRSTFGAPIWPKSFLGSAAFAASAVTITIAFSELGLVQMTAWQAAGCVIGATLIEYVTPFGLDNLTVPIFVWVSVSEWMRLGGL